MAFQKGQSGNPGGRPKDDPEVKELAKSYTTEAIERLAHWLRCDNPKASVTACLALLDRAWGRPLQALEHIGKDGGPIEMTDVDDTEIARRIAFTLARVTQDKPTPTEH